MQPTHPKIYHIVHADRLQSILQEGCLWSDMEMLNRSDLTGTNIGADVIKQRRRNKFLNSHHDLRVGRCVPFYLCPRSTMLYVISRANSPGLSYRDGQGPIIHLEADLRQTVEWADNIGLCWAFTDSNAAGSLSQDWSDLACLGMIDWSAVQAVYWSECKDGKQAEFLVERRFAWNLVKRIGVYSKEMCNFVTQCLQFHTHIPRVEVRRNWYY